MIKLERVNGWTQKSTGYICPDGVKITIVRGHRAQPPVFTVIAIDRFTNAIANLHTADARLNGSTRDQLIIADLDDRIEFSIGDVTATTTRDQLTLFMTKEQQ